MVATESNYNKNVYGAVSVVSLILSAYGNIRYLVGRSPLDPDGPYHVTNTPFLANILVTLTYWAITYLLQAGFVAQIFSPSWDSIDRSASFRSIGWHFSIFNVMSFLWSILFARKHFFLSEIVLIFNFLNIVALYFMGKTYTTKPLSSWLVVHLGCVAMPFSWLMYAIFWNGAVLLHVHKFFGRVVSNVLVWDFLLVPGFLLVAYNDWGVSFSLSILMFGLGLGQLFTKTFALQWIFAFVISGVLMVLSLVVAFNGPLVLNLPAREQAPLLSA